MSFKVLSLFDGMACGLVALKRAGIQVDEYHAFEIDKYAIQVAKKNHPEIIHHGSVVDADFSQFKDFDLVIGGSPCQGFSFAGKQLAFDDPRSKLFFEYVRAVKEVDPRHFMLENVRMKKEHIGFISDLLWVVPVCINSALLSAQNRVRFYWCNWHVEQPDDKGVLLKNIVTSGYVDRDKSYCIDASYHKGGNLRQYFEKSRRQIAFEESGYRKLTPIECERLQTLPDGYTEGVSNTQRYKMLGNGWTVEIISHLFKQMKVK